MKVIQRGGAGAHRAGLLDVLEALVLECSKNQNLDDDQSLEIQGSGLHMHSQ